MKEVIQDSNYDAKCTESSQVKISLAALILRNGGNLNLDPPFIHEGCPIVRVAAHNKMVPARLAYHDEKLGGSFTPGFRLALYTDSEHCQDSKDFSMKQSDWDCYPEVYHALLDWVKNQYPDHHQRNKTWS